THTPPATTSHHLPLHDALPISLTGAGTDTFTGIEAARLTGGPGDDALDASAFPGPVTLDGAAGDDTLTGGAGDDRLVGGTGTNEIGRAAGRGGGGEHGVGGDVE